MKPVVKKVLIASGGALILAGALAFSKGQRALYVGTGYAAKRLCTETFVAGREPGAVEREDLSFLPIPMSMRTDTSAKTATVTSLGVVRSSAAFRPGLGCALTYDTSVEAVQKVKADVQRGVYARGAQWPEGKEVATELPDGIDQDKLTEALDFAFAEPDPEHLRNTRAVVVIHDGMLVAERYGEGYDRDTAMLSWSMAKSVTNAMVGILVSRGELDIRQPAPIEEWSDDARAKITLEHLLHMSSGLVFREDYGAFGDATKMLFVSKDSARTAAAAPLGFEPGSRWYYSSADTNIIQRIIRETIGDDAAYHALPAEALFEPIGAHSAVFETDPGGTFVGSSFVYMTAQDWARFGQLFLQDGVWGDKRLLPEGWVAFSCSKAPANKAGDYGAHWWLNLGNEEAGIAKPYPSLPADTCSAQGFETQRVLVIPSRKTVLVRLGLTRERGAFDTDTFAKMVLDALP
ncbi:MAG: serine hydrolase [Myxococcota bacterium]